MSGFDPELDLLVRGGVIVTMDPQGTVLYDGAVAIRSGQIVDVGPTGELAQKYRGKVARALDATNLLVIPGLINLHVHGADCLFRGLIDDLPLEPWLERLWRLERRFVDRESVFWGAQLAYIEMLLGGTTSALDMFWYPESNVAAARQVGIKLITGPIWFDSSDIDGQTPADRLAYSREFLQEYRRDRLITPCLMPHGTYTVAPEHLATIANLAAEFDVPISTHLSETLTEVETVSQRHGRRPPELLDSMHLLHDNTILAHCVHLDQQEVDLLADRRSVVAHCPLSNLKLGSGIAPVQEMLQRGVRVGLGTDGPVSGNDLDMWLAMRLTAVLHKGARRDPTAVPAERVVSLATREAAAALGRGNEMGALAPGYRADLVLVRLDRPHMTPLYDVYSHLVYTAGRGDVATVIVDGKIVVQNGTITTVDEAQVMAEVARLAAELQKTA